MLSASEIDGLAELAYDSLTSGVSAEDVRDTLALSEEDFKQCLVRMFEVQAEAVRTRPTEHVYVQYVIDQLRNIVDLTDIISDFKNTKQHSAIVSAIKARSDIQDKILMKGQEFGIIVPSPVSGRSLVAGMVIEELSNKQLKKTILRELKAASEAMDDFGEVSFVDIEPGAIHRGPALPPPDVVSEEQVPADVSPKKKVKKKKQRLRVGGRKP
jgi:hypothetical protein